ncbi:MAG: hypothetical protein P4L85_01120 [Paludisphaera borealis]|nr:hypothetical protein [Paludisphaera borealis]MDR3617922.1 hypothetical protein [Paludisphaera borealis]
MSSLREFLGDDWQAFVYQRFIVPASGTIRFARALDRSVTGSMNELIVQATALLVEGELPPFDVGGRLHSGPNRSGRRYDYRSITEIGLEHRRHDPALRPRPFAQHRPGR